jgi:flagellar biosynthesis protein FlhA
VVAEGEVMPECLMAIPSPNVYGELDGIPGIEPAFGMAVTWIAPDQKAHALGQGYQVVEVASAIATHASKMVKDHLHELFRHEDVPAHAGAPDALVAEAGGALDKALTHTQLLRVFRVLLAEERVAEGHRRHRHHAAGQLRRPPRIRSCWRPKCAARCGARSSPACIGKKKDMPAFNLSASWRTCCSVP